MGNLSITRHNCVMVLLQIVLLGQSQVSCTQYKIGGLDSWNVPTAANPSVYTQWPKFHSFKIGDSLLFLYPPSKDSVIQVTQENYKTCNTKDPILYMNDGNSLFNITQNGELYFTSAQPGHCQKNQKLRISAGTAGAAADADSPSDGGPDASSPSYPTVFGSMPLPQKSSSPESLGFPVFIASLACAVVGAIM